MPPGLSIEKELWAEGHDVVVGIDEVGRGAWAGPLTLGAAVIPKDRRVYGVRDSKQLTEKRREELFDRITDWCEYYAIGQASNDECDQLGMSEAQRLAARRALASLGVAPDAVLIDGKWNFVVHPKVTMIVKGDQKSLSIATASIIAKVTRDRQMRQAHVEYPDFNFESNKGYPSPIHREVLASLGATSLHRRSWAFMDKINQVEENKLPV